MKRSSKLRRPQQFKGHEKGRPCFFYHSNEGLHIVGIAKVVKEHSPDTTAKEGDWVGVDFAPHKTLKNPVSLADMKKEPSLKTMELLRIGRLSVSKVTEKEFEKVMEMAGE